MRKILYLGVSCLLAFSSPTYAEENMEGLMDMSFASLMDMEVTLTSRKPERYFETTSAISVLTAEDIRRSGVTTIAEALRMVPGMQVARADANKWRISSRGFNEEFANKLLVLIDGRSVYTPIFSGVYWGIQDTMIEDIDRIEIIRGPGATLWGANAVNGVINIVTKDAADTQGGLFVGGYGSEERGFVGLRYGGKIGDAGHYRIYAKRFDREETKLETGIGANNEWDYRRAGFRSDWATSIENSFTLQGDIYDGEQRRDFTVPTLTSPFATSGRNTDQITGGNILGRWHHVRSEKSNMTLQFYFDLINRDHFLLEQRRDTVDLDFQYVWTPNKRNEVVWGLGYRFIHDNLDDTLYFEFEPDKRSDDIISAFIQDKIHIIPDRLSVTLGTKFEYNDYSKFEIQPSIRTLWTPTNHQAIWAAVSRAVRTPSRGEHDISLIDSSFPSGTFGIPSAGFVTLEGNKDYDSEELIAYEIGYRVQPNDSLFVDVTGFYNDYHNLRSFELGTPFARSATGFADHFVLPFNVDNKAYAETYGLELTTAWDVSKDWRLSANYTFLTMNIHTKADSSDTLSERDEERSPKNQFSLRSHLDLPNDIEVNNSLYYVDSLSNIDIPSYIRFDTQLVWRPVHGLELSLVGQNLLDDNHPEFLGPGNGSNSEISRSVYGKILWQF